MAHKSGRMFVTKDSYSRAMSTRTLQCPDYSHLVRPVKPQPQPPKQKPKHKNSGHNKHGQRVDKNGTPLAICGVCGAPAVQRKSKYGRFWSCTRYPICTGKARSLTSKWKTRRPAAPASVLPTIQTT